MLECNQIRKKYARRATRRTIETTEVLKGLDLTVGDGDIYGLLGLNGAGKTTLIRIISGILRPDSGSVVIDGKTYDKNEKEIKKSLGVVLGGDRSLYWKLTAVENLQFFGSLYNMNSRELNHSICEKLSYVGLLEKKDALVETYSRGMKQRLLIAKALLTNPKLLLLDEPTVGLDVQIAHDFRELILMLNREYHITILLTTHYLNEAEELCSHIGVLRDGVIKQQGTINKLTESFPYNMHVTIRLKAITDEEILKRRIDEIGLLSYYGAAADKTTKELQIFIGREHTFDSLLRAAHELNAQITEITQRDITLEDIILNG